MKTTEISHIYESFKTLTLPKEEWTHEAHLVTALSLLNDHGLKKAEALMPDMIREYNTSQGGVNSSTDGYHHTITIFYLRVIEKFRMKNKRLNFENLAAQLLGSEIAEPYYTLNFFSKELLFTPKARLGLVQPDLKNY